MEKLKRLLTREYQHFLQLSPDAHKLLLSSAIYCLANPLVNVFINAFILRKTDSFISVGIYNLGYFFTLPLTFYMNGFLLRRISIKKLFFVGLVGQGLVTGLVFFWPTQTVFSLFVLGLLQGIPLGLYWANRNFLTMSVTHDGVRNYYGSIEVISSAASNIVVPILFGWIIVLGEYFHWYLAESAYQFLIVIVLALLVFAGLLFQSANVKNPVIKNLRVTTLTAAWWYCRLMQFCRGFWDRMIDFLPPILVLSVLGKEEVLGTAHSLMAVVSMCVLYWLGRKSRAHHRLLILGVVIAFFFVLSIVYGVWFSPLLAMVIILFLGVGEQPLWMVYNPILLKAVEETDQDRHDSNYAYVVDEEIFLNIGRMVCMGFFFAFIAVSRDTALRYIPFVVALFQVFLWFAAGKLLRLLSQNSLKRS